MPNGLLDDLLDGLRVDEPRPVVVVDPGPGLTGFGAAGVGAGEARRRGAPLRRVEAPTSAAAALADQASVLVVHVDSLPGAGVGAPWRHDLAGLVCPVLLTCRREAPRSAPPAGPVVALAAGAPQDCLEVVDAAAAQAVRRGTALHLVHREPVGGGSRSPGCDGWAAELMARLGLTQPLAPASPVTVSHVAGDGGARVGRLTREAVVVVDDRAPDTLWSDLRATRADVLVVPGRSELPGEAATAVYRAALLDDLAAEPARDDHCTTPEDLDDLWRLGTASPQVSGRVVRAWRACLEGRTGARVHG